jgi:hypothetical protein
MDFIRADRKTIEQHVAALESKNKLVEDYIFDERNRINAKLNVLIKTLGDRDILNTIQLQSDALNLRQEMVDEIAKWMTKYSAQKSAYSKSVADRMEYYMSGYGLKTTNGEKVQMMDRDLREVKRGLELIELHIEFLRDTRASCDNIGYAMKNRTTMLQYI